MAYCCHPLQFHAFPTVSFSKEHKITSKVTIAGGQGPTQFSQPLDWGELRAVGRQK